ncbi:hypothetical protein [Aureivirga sp. CE67]|uniref:hypothetical protein n=1 Tax=Aureivirga sp. CE67 TaxID=1788983 RepID=UPI0018CAED09|nr:hypothetical protein [Aureivirga sp. CE67]
MNVLFHLSVGVGIIAAMSHQNLEKNRVLKIGSGFLLGVLSHGVLDYTPHCYPINSKIDVILGLFIILLCIKSVKKEFRILVSAVLFGCIFPDIIDLSPGIINKLLGWNLPTFENIFPWHIHKYSGSIYSDDCNVSNINHILTLVFSAILIILNRKSALNLIK